MEAKEAIWKKCLEKIEENILPDSFTTWFSPTYPRYLNDGLITIAVHNQFYRKCLIENYRELIEKTLAIAKSFHTKSPEALCAAIKSINNCFILEIIINVCLDSFQIYLKN